MSIPKIKKYDIFNIIRLQTNAGLGNALRLAVDNASYEFIARMDSDDISLRNRISDELDYLRRYDLDICGSAVTLFGDDKGKKRLLFIQMGELEEMVRRIVYLLGHIH